MKLIKGEDIDFYYLTKPEEVKDLVHVLQNEKLIAGDTEVYPDYEKWGDQASWRNPYTSQVRLWQLNVPNNSEPWVLDLMKIGIEGLSSILEWMNDSEIRKIYHNAVFDIKQIRSSLGVWIPNTWCTKVMMQRLGICTGFKSSQMRGHSLKALARDFFDIHLSKLEQTSNWADPNLSESQLEYAALDVGAPKSSLYQSILLEGYELILETLTSPIPIGFDVEYPLKIDQEANQILAQVEYNGMPINVKMLDALMNQARSELEELKLKLCADLNFPAEQKLVFVNGSPQRIVMVPDQIAKLLNSPKELVKVVNEKLDQSLDDLQSSTLERLIQQIQSENQEESEEAELDQEFLMKQASFSAELISNLLAYKEKVKLVGTDYKKLINPVTKRLHTSMQVLGASTSRMSSGGNEAFNAQQLSTTKVVIEELEDPFYSEQVS